MKRKVFLASALFLALGAIGLLGQPASIRPFFQKIWNLISRTGGVFIAIAFGAIFSGVFIASLTALVERINFIVDFTRSLMLPGG